MMKSHLFTVSAFVLAASLLAGNAALAAGSDAARDTPRPYSAVKDLDLEEPRPRFDAARDRMAPSFASAEPNYRAVAPRARTPVKDGDWDEVPARVDGAWIPAFE